MPAARPTNKRIASVVISFALLAGLFAPAARAAGGLESTSLLQQQVHPRIPFGKHLSAALEDGGRSVLNGQADGRTESSDGNGKIVPGQYIVAFKASIAHPASLAHFQAERYEGQVGIVYRHILKGYLATGLSKGDAESLKHNPNVRFVEPNRVVTAESQTVPTGIARTFAPADSALKINEKEDYSVNANVAVIDTGIDSTQPDLNVVGRVNCVPAGEGYLSEEELEPQECVENSGTDGFGHGTHVAGTIGAKDNGFGVVGVAPGVRLWAVKVLNSEGEGTLAWIISGIEWVAATRTDSNPNNDIEVANMSLGCGCESQAWEQAISGYEEGASHIPGAVDAGVVIVVAAGNDHANATYRTPSGNPDAITVSALADSDGKPGGEGPTGCFNDSWGQTESLTDDTLAPFSNWGAAVDVAAPGVCILSTVPIGGSHLSPSKTAEYATASGTSMAAPHVAGAAAVLASESKPENKADVEAIRQQIVDHGNLEYKDTSEDSTQEPLLDLIQPNLSVATGGTSEPNGEAKTAVLHGVLNPAGQAVSYWFEYGPTESYGQTTVKAETKAETKFINVSATASGLKLAQTYHYRLTVLDSKGVYHHGVDRTVLLSRWKLQATPEDEKWPELRDISCTSGSFCMAIGKQSTPTGEIDPYWGRPTYTPTELIEKWDGSKWSVVPPPAGTEKQEYSLLQVSCSSASFCMATGYHSGYFAWTWNGTGWTSISVPSGFSIGNIACLSASWCMGVGESDKSTRMASYLWNGTGWTEKAVPLEAESAWLNAISCTSTSFCEAVGEAPGEAGRAAMATKWDGSKWAAVEALPKPPALSKLLRPEFEQYFSPIEAAGYLVDISCTSESACMAVGRQKKDFENEYIFTGGYGERLAGGKWTAEPIDQYQEVELEAVSCVAASQCTAVGWDWRGKEARPRLAHLWNGTSWGDEASATLPENAGSLNTNGVSCLPDGTCTLAGDYFEREECVGAYCFGEDFALAEVSRATAPTASTGQPKTVWARSALLTGTVNPDGLEGEYEFEWGTQAEFEAGKYGHVTQQQSLGSEFKELNATQEIEGLAPESTYHFRVVASTGLGTAYGKDMSFTTRPEVSGAELAALGVTDPFDGGASSLTDFSNNFTMLSWALGKGEDKLFEDGTFGWNPKPFMAYGASYNPTLSDVGWGVADSVKVQERPESEGSYASLWLDLPGSGGEKSGYELRFQYVIAEEKYKATLSKWVNGTKTELASQSSYALPAHATIALADQGQKVTAWVNPKSGSTPLLTATDSTFAGGTAGIEGSGGTVLLTSFKASALRAPVAATEAGSEVRVNRAKLNGAVNPNGQATSYWFEYGTTSSYGSKAPASPGSAGSGTSSVAASQALTGLTSGTTYHYRLVAESAAGKNYGLDKTVAVP